jgi:quercetin dioxygenase-like cupin family protein
VEIQPRRPSVKGDPEFFTGEVWIDNIGNGGSQWPLRVSNVHFTPGARSVWHSHMYGQVLYVTEGEGLVQSGGSEVIRVKPGDIVHTPANEWHWHGASPEYFMSHISVTEGAPHGDPRPEPEWGEPVSDNEYHGHSH